MAETETEKVETNGHPEPPKKLLEHRVTGVVKWYNVKAGYGFINRNDTKTDIFVHKSAINKFNSRKNLPSLAENEEVEFYVVEGVKGDEAYEVTGPGGIAVKGSSFAPTGGRMNGYNTFPRGRGRICVQANYYNGRGRGFQGYPPPTGGWLPPGARYRGGVGVPGGPAGFHGLPNRGGNSGAAGGRMGMPPLPQRGGHPPPPPHGMPHGGPPMHHPGPSPYMQMGRQSRGGSGGFGGPNSGRMLGGGPAPYMGNNGYYGGGNGYLNEAPRGYRTRGYRGSYRPRGRGGYRNGGRGGNSSDNKPDGPVMNGHAHDMLPNGNMENGIVNGH